MTSQPNLKLPDFESTIFVQTDPSDRGLGVVLVLLQWENDVRLTVVFANRKLSKSERNYSVVEKECLGIALALQKLGKYLC